MPELNWIETKREYEVDEFGNKRVKRITHELDKPEPPKTWWTKHKDQG